MYCKKCDIKLDENVSVCPTCGNKVKLQKVIKISILTIIVIAIIILLGIFFANKINEKKEKEMLNNQIVEIKTLTKEKYVTFAGYTFLLPNNLQYSNVDNYIYAATKDLKISFKMNVVENSYDDIIDKSKRIIEAINKSGTQVISSNTLKFEGKEYFLIATIQNNNKSLYLITELNSTHCAQALIESTNDEYETGISYINLIVNNYEKINADINIPNTATLDDFFATNSSNNYKIDDLFNPQTEE